MPFFEILVFINKFERDYKQPSLEYRFLNAYPISIDSMPVAYDGVNTLKCTVNFNFSRYITPVTVLKKASYPVTGSSDSSQFITGAGRIETGLTASTNAGAQESAAFDPTALNATLNN